MSGEQHRLKSPIDLGCCQFDMVPHEADTKMEICVQEVYGMVLGSKSCGEVEEDSQAASAMGELALGPDALLKCPASRLRGRAHITPLTPVTRRSSPERWLSSADSSS